MSSLALTELLGSPVFDTAGSQCGRVREVALVPQILLADLDDMRSGHQRLLEATNFSRQRKSA